MKAIKPLAITDAMLISSSVSEDDYDVYNAGITYGIEDRVIITTTGVHKVYESLKEANTGNYPPSNLTGVAPWWSEVSSTNRWKMFDYVVQTQTEDTSFIVVVIKPGEVIDSIAIMNIDAAYLIVVMNDPVAGEVYRALFILVATEIVLWESETAWSIGEAWQGGSYNDLVDKMALKTDLPVYPNASLTITISSSGITAKCGVLVIGNHKDLGETRYSPAAGIRDYSIKEADVYGNYTILERAFSKIVSANFFMLTSAHESVLRFLTHYRATALVWILSEEYNVTVVYGFYKNFLMTISNLELSECDIDIEGLS